MSTLQTLFRRYLGSGFIASIALLAALGACSGGGGVGGGAVSPELALFAGNLDGIGSIDGSAREARFFNPGGVASDSTGNVYVTDSGNHTIRKITAAGVVSTFAGMAGSSGSADGSGNAARFTSPYGIAIDSANNLYVADSGNHTIRKITSGGVVSTFAGTAGSSGSEDGSGAAARFNNPHGIAIDSNGHIYVADTANHTIRSISASGMVTAFAGLANNSGTMDGIGTVARFYSPQGLATDSAGNVYVADTGNHAIRIINPNSGVSIFAGKPGSGDSLDGSGIAARFNMPRGIAIDGAGTIYVADSGNNTIRKITAGVVATFAGTAGVYGDADGSGAAAEFKSPYSVATDNAGNVYVADTYNNTIRKITSAGVVSTLAGAYARQGSVDGIAAAARFNAPYGVATDSAGSVYVADTINHTIRKITAAGVVSTLAGSAGSSGNVDGSGAAALFEAPQGVATDSAGNVYVADTHNETIRKITPAGVVSTLAGTADNIGSVDGSGAAAGFNGPQGVASDSAGNVYVADTFNHTIRKITPAGAVTTLAGTAGRVGSADGSGAVARFYYPIGITTDSRGNVYVADSNNHTIRKITPAGVVSTYAGTAGSMGAVDGSGAAAHFNFPQGVACDSADNVYVADTANHTIRKINRIGAVSTITGVAGRAGFAPGPLPGGLLIPRAIAVFGTSLYITLGNGVAVVTNRP
jgi:sugar lactone lactonase YvrE